MPSQLRVVGSKLSVDLAHPQSSGLLLPRGKARARAPRSQRQPLQKVQSKSEPKGHVASIEAAIRALGPNPEPTVLASLRDVLRKAKEVQDRKPVREAVSKSPDEVRADAVARVDSLEAAIAALGDHDNQARKAARGSSREFQEPTWPLSVAIEGGELSNPSRVVGGS